MHDISEMPLSTLRDEEFNRAIRIMVNVVLRIVSLLNLVVGKVPWNYSRYIRRTKILKIDENLAKSSIVPFVNIFDKGYRVLLDTQKCNQF